MVFNLPPIPPELKAMTPYLQRADELRAKEPVMAYWCAYYAAQVGIGLKLKDASARSFLFEVLAVLERLKADLGPNDAIDDEPASAAYVENFALKVFAAADNEDRSGRATRATAKKFLAAANFLEVLAVFAADSSAEPTRDKIRYAKWKAADIARAFREGRTPAPGPAPDPNASAEPPAQQASPPTQHPQLAHSRTPSDPSLIRATPPPPALAYLPTFPAHALDPQSPGAWSTAAAPGTPPVKGARSPSHDRSRGGLRTAWVSGEMEGHDSDADVGPESEDPANRKVHFSPSVVGGLSSAPPIPAIGGGDHPGRDGRANATHGQDVGKDGHGFGLGLGSGIGHGGGYMDNAPGSHDGFAPSAPPYPSSPPLPPSSPPASSPSPSAPPPTLYSPPTHQPHLAHAPPAPADPDLVVPPPGALFAPIAPFYSPPPPSGFTSTPPHPYATPAASAYSTSVYAPQPAELTATELARVQRHCRFAISALDYEDVEQARKELRAALNALGG